LSLCSAKFDNIQYKPKLITKNKTNKHKTNPPLLNFYFILLISSSKHYFFRHSLFFSTQKTYFIPFLFLSLFPSFLFLFLALFFLFLFFFLIFIFFCCRFFSHLYTLMELYTLHSQLHLFLFFLLIYFKDFFSVFCLLCVKFNFTKKFEKSFSFCFFALELSKTIMERRFFVKDSLLLPSSS
jgi:hypothetical protein